MIPCLEKNWSILWMFSSEKWFVRFSKNWYDLAQTLVWTLFQLNYIMITIYCIFYQKSCDNMIISILLSHTGISVLNAYAEYENILQQRWTIKHLQHLFPGCKSFTALPLSICQYLYHTRPSCSSNLLVRFGNEIY